VKLLYLISNGPKKGRGRVIRRGCPNRRRGGSPGQLAGWSAGGGAGATCRKAGKAEEEMWMNIARHGCTQ